MFCLAPVLALNQTNSFKDFKLNLRLGLSVYGCFINRNNDASQDLASIESAVVSSHLDRFGFG